MKNSSITKKAILTGMLSLVFVVGSAAEVPLSGKGTAESPYLISTTDDWTKLADYMANENSTMEGLYVNLTADIDMTGKEFKPLATFNGIFNGQNHTVSGIYYTTTASYNGAFASTVGGTIKNLTLKGEITTENDHTGGFTGNLSGNIANCVNLINITSSKLYTAGFTGKALTGAKLENCVNKAEIKSSQSSIAGIVAEGDNGVNYIKCGNEGVIHATNVSSYISGITANSLPSTFDGCYNIGEIIMDKTTCSSVAGILGYANNVKNAQNNKFIFKDCYNTAYIQASVKVAGIVADLNFSNVIPTTLEMTGCYNTGTIVSSGSTSGNIGTAGISCFYAPGSKFINCHNSGTIKAEAKPYCGGIVGHFKQIYSNTPESTFVTGCYNTGEIQVTPGQGAGILAYAHKNVTVENCYNTGKISGKSTLGGILSTMATGSRLINCWNAGEVTTTAESAAGIVPNNANHCLISGCLNVGDITAGTKTAGGIGATCGSEIVNCVNFGHIKGTSEIGGLVGAPRKDNTTFDHCYNAGIVETPDHVGGGLIGVSTEATGSWSEKNTVTESYYLTGLNTFTQPQAGTPMGIADLVKLDLGENYTLVAPNCMPLPKQYSDNPAALANAAAVVPQNGEGFDLIKSDFLLGVPNGVKWQSSSNLITIDENTAKLSVITTPSDATLTACLGEFSRVWSLKLDKASGINDISNQGDAQPLSRSYYNIAGQLVAEPSDANQIYIVKEVYPDGSVVTRKVTR